MTQTEVAPFTGELPKEAVARYETAQAFFNSYVQLRTQGYEASAQRILDLSQAAYRLANYLHPVFQLINDTPGE